MANVFYIIGGSGAGKDSLIDYVKKHLSENEPIEFVRRYITRPSTAGGENHLALTEEEFLQYKDNDHFVMNWFSHNTHYGIGTEINHWLSKNISVVMNGSRAYLSEAINKYPDIIPILISVDPLILSERLCSRGRESYDEIQKRIAQAVELESTAEHPNMITIENNASLEEAGDHLLSVITNKLSNKCA